MGVRVDLIDRAVYGSNYTNEQSQKNGEDIVFSERDKFLLSDRDTIPVIKAKP